MANNVPTTPSPVKGEGTLLNKFRGIHNGVPYGEQLEHERRTRNRVWKFSPGVARKLSGATRKALGRA